MLLSEKRKTKKQKKKHVMQYCSLSLRKHKLNNGTVFSTFCQSLQPVEGTDKLELSLELADVLLAMQCGKRPAATSPKVDVHCIAYAALDSFNNWRRSKGAEDLGASLPSSCVSLAYAKLLPKLASSNAVDLAAKFFKSGLFKHRASHKDITSIALHYGINFVYLDEGYAKLDAGPDYMHFDASFMKSQPGMNCYAYAPAYEGFEHLYSKTLTDKALELCKTILETSTCS